MIKHLGILLSISILALTATAQKPTTQPTSKPTFGNYRPTNLNNDSLIEERLVALALQGPQYQISDHQNKIAEKNLSATKKTWLNLLTISANYNDQSFAKQAPTANGTAYVYPKYYFGLTIPLGLIFGMGSQVKIAREQLEVSRSTQEQLARQIRADILTKYHQYKAFSNLIALQNQVVLDEQAALSQTEKKFKDGSITIEMYNGANKAFNDDVAKKLNLQLQQDLMKIEIERIIGTRLENAIN